MSIMAELGKIQTKRMARLDVGAPVAGVTQLDNRIYAVCANNKFLAYDAETFAQLADDNVVLEGTSTELWDIAACRDEGLLYTYDFSKKCFLRGTKEGRHFEEWIRHAVSRISVTSDGHVLLLTEDPPSLDIHKADGSLVRTIRLPLDTKHPKHAVESSYGTYLVTHGWKGIAPHRIYEITRDGEMVKCFDGKVSGGARGEVEFCPVHMAVDSEGHIYVADWDNNQVLVMDGELTDYRVLFKYDKCRPMHVCYVPEMKRLLIGLGDGHIDVHSLSFL